MERRTPIPRPTRCRARRRRPRAGDGRSALHSPASRRPPLCRRICFEPARPRKPSPFSLTCPCAPTRGCARSTSAAWQGLTFDEVSAIDPAGAAAWRDGGSGRRGGGETLVEVGERATAAVREALADVDDGGVLIVATHGACGPGDRGLDDRVADDVVACARVTGELLLVGGGGERHGLAAVRPQRRVIARACTGRRPVVAGSARLRARPRGPFGALAQLVEHLPGRQGVRGSSPLSSTHKSRRCFQHQRVHEGLGQVAAHLALVDVELLAEDPRRPARSAGPFVPGSCFHAFARSAARRARRGTRTAERSPRRPRGADRRGGSGTRSRRR